MISNKIDYKEYLKADEISLNIKNRKKELLFNEIWKFQRMMRRLEYVNNCKKGVIYKIYKIYLKYRYVRKSRKLGFSIPINVFGPGLSIAHRGTIVVSASSRIGANCRIHVCTNIGTKAGFSDKAPILGNNIYIGPGVKLFGDIYISNNTAIGANSVVNKSFYEENIGIAGIPAKKINNKGTDGLLIKGYKNLEG